MKSKPVRVRSQRPNPWRLYETLKGQLPPLSAREYEAACRAIAKRLGL